MKYYNTFFIVLLILLILSLVVSHFLLFNENTVNTEGFQSFSLSQIEDMSRCIPSSYSIVDPKCTYVKYYESSGIIKDGYFSNLPNNYYIDICNILQPIPFGNFITPDRRGYVPINNKSQYTKMSIENASAKENVINPFICKEGDKDFYNKSICYDASYLHLDANNNIEILNNTIKIPDGYYVNNGIVNKIPYGYVYVNPNDKRTIQLKSTMEEQLSKTKYNTNNYDVEYHSKPSGNNVTDQSTAGEGKMWVLDNSKNLIAIPYSDVSNNTLYYEPGSFRFESSNYVPKYEESVYLSKLTNAPSFSLLKDVASMGMGFCDYYKNNPDELERMCNDQSGNTCGSLKCCVLLGGEKCVHGNKNGPKFKSNYSNFNIKNPEYYYYQGKCYGNCK